MARIKYAQSLAGSSVVGYLTGLGDRHCQIILINRQTAEIVHVDLNLIFDQGKLLKIPERVPFRLTQNVLDGLGSFGIEDGLFFDTLEQSLELLRESQEKILTVLQVFRYDPLYKWSASQEKTKRLQRENNSSSYKTTPSCKELTNFDDNFIVNHSSGEADRVLLKMKEKLSGIEEGNLFSTSGHIHYLIGLATRS